MLGGLDYEQIDLIDYKICPLGQNFADDEFGQVWSKMRAAEPLSSARPCAPTRTCKKALA